MYEDIGENRRGCEFDAGHARRVYIWIPTIDELYAINTYTRSWPYYRT